MASGTNLETNLRAAQQRVQYDASCKRMLSEKIILAWIMKYCVKEYADCTVHDIAEKYIEGEPQVGEIPVAPDETNIIRGMNTEDVSITEGTVYYDIRFFAAAPVSGELIRLIINVEAQSDFYPGYSLLKRGIYYCARMISAQYGAEFTKANYDEIKKVYSIWICSKPPKERANSITRYYITEENLIGSVKEKVKNYDLLSVIMVCLGEPSDEKTAGLLRLLDILLSHELPLERKRHVLDEEFHIKMSHKLEGEVNTMCNLSQGILNEGIERGRLEGRAEGRELNEIANIRTIMKKTGWNLKQTMEFLDVPETKHAKYLDLLKQ